jgi:hypothetical protein
LILIKSDGSCSVGEDDDIATVEETFDETETSSGLANTSPNSIRGCTSPILAPSNGSNNQSLFNSRTETSPTTAAVASVQAALAALQAGQMSLNQLQTLGAQNALWQSQLSNTAVVGNPMTPFSSSNSVVTPNFTQNTTTANSLNNQTSNNHQNNQNQNSENSPNLNGFGRSDLQALQIALQQQQQNLQQQVQNFILFQQPNNVQTSAMLLQSQISQAVTQATNQLRLLQRHQSNNSRVQDQTQSYLPHYLHTHRVTF